MSANQSLAQFVAKMGGICPSTGDRGEIERVQTANRYLRGRNSIIRPGGTPADEILADVRAEGFPVHHDNLLDLLVQDAWGLIEKTDKHRVYRDYVLTDRDLDPFEEDPMPDIANEFDPTRCVICGHLVGFLPCHPCLAWYQRIADPLRYERGYCSSTPISALSWHDQEILIEALTGWIQ